MSVIRLHCPRCGADFIDARPELRHGDDVTCPACRAPNTVSTGDAIAGRIETVADIPVRKTSADDD
jgi:uncharacterized Zn finger protein (UPF0148 family)